MEVAASSAPTVRHLCDKAAWNPSSPLWSADAQFRPSSKKIRDSKHTLVPAKAVTGRFAPQRRSLLPRFFGPHPFGSRSFGPRFFTGTYLRSPAQHQLLQAETWRARQAAPLQCAIYAAKSAVAKTSQFRTGGQSYGFSREVTVPKNHWNGSFFGLYGGIMAAHPADRQGAYTD